MIFGDSHSRCSFFFNIPQIQDQFHADLRYDNRFFVTRVYTVSIFFDKVGAKPLTFASDQLTKMIDIGTPPKSLPRGNMEEERSPEKKREKAEKAVNSNEMLR